MLIDPILGKSLSIRRKANNTPNLLSRIRRVSRGATEVMIKITGFGKGLSHIQSHLDYISRKGKTELESESGEILKDNHSINEYFDCWKKDINTSRAYRANNRDTLHLVLSMPAHVDSESVRKATRDFAKETFGNHAFVFALHTDGSNPHCHLSVRMEGFDGKRLNPKKADLQDWRDTFAEKMRDQGYEAESTPRYIRGITKKAERAVLRHIEKHPRRGKPRHPKVYASRIREAINEISGTPEKPRPWEQAIRGKQAQVRQAWLQTADDLARRRDPKNADLPFYVRNMVDAMPPIETERDRTKLRLMKWYRKAQEKAPATVTVKREKERDLEG
jgi:hypothetical protein